MSEIVVSTQNLTRRFGDFIAVDHVNFEVHAGEIVGYLGPNGCGKTTTIRMLLGLLEPTEGNALVLGFDSFKQSEEVRARSGYMSQKFALYDDLTVWENLAFYAGVYGVSDKKHISQTLDLTGLTGREREITHGLSAGWRQRLALGIALVHQPKLLFLDEPTSGVDPIARREFWDLIYQLAGTGVTIFITTHYMDEAEYCHQVGLMRSGKLLAFNSPSQLKTATLHGEAWDINCSNLVETFEIIEHLDGVVQISLLGDLVHFITKPKVFTSASISSLLERKGVHVTRITSSEITLEDAFMNLTRR